MAENSNTNNLELIAKVQLSGSLLAKNRDTLAFQADVNNVTDGFIFAPQKKETYNIEELKKAIDVEVTELVPPNPEDQLDLVPRTLYEEALEALVASEETIDVQSATIATLESTIIDLESQVESLTEEVDNEKLLRVLAEENFENARQEISIIVQEAQLSYQRSIIEGIEKSTLEAKNEGLVAQVEALKDELANLQSEVDSLNSTIEGKEAQIAQGAKAGIDLTLLVKNKTIEDGMDIIYRQRNSASTGTWINGPDVEVYNFTSNTVKVSISATGRGWIALNNATQNLKNASVDIFLSPNEKRTLIFQALNSANYASVSSDREYRGTIKFTTTSGTTTLTTALQKQVGATFKQSPKISYN